MARTSKLLRSVLVQPVDNIGTLARATQERDKVAVGEDQNEAFTAAKNLLQSDSLMVHFDQDKPILLACDASPYGVGAVFSHQMPDGSERPIAFALRSLSPTERNYSKLDKEELRLGLPNSINICME